MVTNKAIPRVFISYSWSTPDHERRILELAERLRADGVDIILDKWDLVEGHDTNKFMEIMVTDKDVTKVLIFSDQSYAEKADLRKGGVGTESQIISQEVYSKVEQTKFIPIVCERGVDGKPCLPIFLRSRKYIDFSSVEKTNEEYDQLLRAIFDRPLHQKPKLGTPPKHLFEEIRLQVMSRFKLQTFRDMLISGKNPGRGLAVDFLESALKELQSYSIKVEEGEFVDEVVLKTFKEMLPLRDTIIEFFDLVSKYVESPEIYEFISEWFESVAVVKVQTLNSLHGFGGDHIGLLLHELFLYFGALLIKHKRFDEFNAVTSRMYSIPTPASSGQRNLHEFQVFRSFPESLETYRKARVKHNRLSMTADLIKERATLVGINFEQIMQADGAYLLKSVQSTQSRAWYPVTCLYAGYHRTFDIFHRAASRRNFKPIQKMFGIATKEELLAQWEQGSQAQGVQRWTDFTFHSDINFRQLFNLDALDSLP